MTCYVLFCSNNFAPIFFRLGSSATGWESVRGHSYWHGCSWVGTPGGRCLSPRFLIIHQNKDIHVLIHSSSLSYSQGKNMKKDTSYYQNLSNHVYPRSWTREVPNQPDILARPLQLGRWLLFWIFLNQLTICEVVAVLALSQSIN